MCNTIPYWSHVFEGDLPHFAKYILQSNISNVAISSFFLQHSPIFILLILKFDAKLKKKL